MRIVDQSLSIINGLSPMEHIEKIGRICYKSEDKIEAGVTAPKFIETLFNSKHHAMLEHYRFIMQVSPVIYELLSNINHKYFQMTNTEYNGNQRMVISFNARGLLNIVEDSNCIHYGIMPMVVAGVRDELIGHIIRCYGCYELFGWSRNKTPILSTGVEFIANSPDAMNEREWKRHGWRSVHFITDRGISHELVRHRDDTSFAQESTRFCNYGANKFGKEITVINQGFEGAEYEAWGISTETAEKVYFRLLDMGIKPQMARSVLPTCLKTEIVITAPVYEWEHIMSLRYYGTTGAPHPMVQKLVAPLAEKRIFDYEKD